MKDGPKDEKNGKDKKEEEDLHQGSPPLTEDFPLETPFYEQQFDPFVDPENPPALEEMSEDRPAKEDDDWNWREPDDYWLEEGMWPWPEPRPRRTKEESNPPQDVEPG